MYMNFDDFCHIQHTLKSAKLPSYTYRSKIGLKSLFLAQNTGTSKIADINVNEIKIEVAKYSVKEKIWGEAKKILEGINEEKRTNVAYQLLAEIAGSQNKPNEVKEYLKKAATAKLSATCI